MSDDNRNVEFKRRTKLKEKNTFEEKKRIVSPI